MCTRLAPDAHSFDASSKALISLQWLVGSYLSFFMSKIGGPRSQSWDNVPLTAAQQRYAAGDGASAGLTLR